MTITYNDLLESLTLSDLVNLKKLHVEDNENLASIDCSNISYVQTFTDFSYDNNVTITCDKTLINVISSPALLEIKKKIEPITPEMISK
ncbi:MAG: hypothetical protein GPJ51_10005 [Candidatus Heimdallarchaeota archaeon]|nr:hypothetical protein [Candidatus Heimdallarchaeota archaeon]